MSLLGLAAGAAYTVDGPAVGSDAELLASGTALLVWGGAQMTSAVLSWERGRQWSAVLGLAACVANLWRGVLADSLVTVSFYAALSAILALIWVAFEVRRAWLSPARGGGEP
ncbi:MAG: hypothetical protein AAFP22_07535 [Planctomycetota bacterium]